MCVEMSGQAVSEERHQDKANEEKDLFYLTNWSGFKIADKPLKAFIQIPYKIIIISYECI